MQLSEKELLMISESLKGHLGTVEKMRNFSQACTDQEMKQLLDNHARQMEAHSQELFNMVQSGAMTGTSGYSPYSQAHQYGGGQYGTQPSMTQNQYSIGAQSQGSTQQSMGFQRQPVTPDYGQGTQQRMGSQSQYQQKY